MLITLYQLHFNFDVFPNTGHRNQRFVPMTVSSCHLFRQSPPVKLNKYLKSFVIGRTTDLMRQSLNLRCIAIMDMSAAVPSVA
jgi:hypothetical protein